MTMNLNTLLVVVGAVIAAMVIFSLTPVGVDNIPNGIFYVVVLLLMFLLLIALGVYSPNFQKNGLFYFLILWILAYMAFVFASYFAYYADTLPIMLIPSRFGTGGISIQISGDAFTVLTVLRELLLACILGFVIKRGIGKKAGNGS